jgi:hypothetical protein
LAQVLSHDRLSLHADSSDKRIKTLAHATQPDSRLGFLPMV